MTIHAGRLQQIVSDLFEIGVADATGLYPHQDLARTDFRDGNRFHVHAARTAIDRGLHGRCRLWQGGSVGKRGHQTSRDASFRSWQETLLTVPQPGGNGGPGEPSPAL